MKKLLNDNLHWIVPSILIGLALFVSPLWGNVLLAWLLFGSLLTLFAVAVDLFCETMTAFLPELKETLEKEYIEYNKALSKLRQFTFHHLISAGFIVLYAYYGWWICFALASFNLLIPKAFASFVEKKEE